MNELRPQTPEEYQMMRDEGVKAPVPVRSGSDYVAAAAHMGQQTNVEAPAAGSAAPFGRQIVPKYGEQEFAVGQDLTPVTEERAAGVGPRTAGNWLVRGVGAYFGRSGKNEPSVSDALRSMRGPDGDAGLAKDLTGFMQTGVAPARLKGREATLSQVSLLMFSRETVAKPGACGPRDDDDGPRPRRHADGPGAEADAHADARCPGELTRPDPRDSRRLLAPSSASNRPARVLATPDRSPVVRSPSRRIGWSRRVCVDSPAFQNRSTAKAYLLQRLRGFYRLEHVQVERRSGRPVMTTFPGSPRVVRGGLVMLDPQLGAGASAWWSCSTRRRR